MISLGRSSSVAAVLLLLESHAVARDNAGGAVRCSSAGATDGSGVRTRTEPTALLTRECIENDVESSPWPV